MCKVKLEHNNIQKMCKFFVVPGNRQALLGMPDIDRLNIMKINCNTIGTHRNDSADNYSTNTSSPPEFKSCITLHKHDAGSEQGHETLCKHRFYFKIQK